LDGISKSGCTPSAKSKKLADGVFLFGTIPQIKKRDSTDYKWSKIEDRDRCLEHKKELNCGNY